MPVKKRRRTLGVKTFDTEPVYQQSPIYQPPASNRPSTILIILLIAVSFFAGYLFFKLKSLEKGTTVGTTQPAQNQQAPPARTELKIKKPSGDDHWRGDKNARYVWVEYSDLECPFCKQIHPNLVKLMNENKDKVAWVFRHYPLPFHPKAQKSGEAVECVADQGGDESFWKMVDAIYEKMPSLELTQLADAASEIGADKQGVQQCLDSGKNEKKVKSQQEEGTKSGVQATPTNVIYDMKTGKNLLVEGALPYEQLKTSLNTFLTQNK